MSTAPAPLRATTVAGAILAVIFIALSAVVGGINVWRTHAAETFTSQAEQAQSDKASINRAFKDAKTRLDSVNVDASAAAWCDSVTRGNASSMRDIIKTYDSSTQAVKDSIHSQCSNKEALANAQRTLSNADFTIAMTECTANKVTTTIKGTLAVKQSSTITMFGPLNVTVIGYTTEKNKSFNPTSPYQGTHDSDADTRNAAHLFRDSPLRSQYDRQYRVRGHDDSMVALGHVTLMSSDVSLADSFQLSSPMAGYHERSLL